MNTSPSTPNLELLHKVVQEFQPNPRRVPFNNLKPFHDSILELRGKNASYASIAELLQQNGVNTSRARVAEYGRVVLEVASGESGGSTPAPHQPSMFRHSPREILIAPVSGEASIVKVEAKGTTLTTRSEP